MSRVWLGESRAGSGLWGTICPHPAQGSLQGVPCVSVLNIMSMCRLIASTAVAVNVAVEWFAFSHGASRNCFKLILKITVAGCLADLAQHQVSLPWWVSALWMLLCDQPHQRNVKYGLWCYYDHNLINQVPTAQPRGTGDTVCIVFAQFWCWCLGVELGWMMRLFFHESALFSQSLQIWGTGFEHGALRNITKPPYIGNAIETQRCNRWGDKLTPRCGSRT